MQFDQVDSGPDRRRHNKAEAVKTRQRTSTKPGVVGSVGQSNTDRKMLGATVRLAFQYLYYCTASERTRDEVTSMRSP